MVKFTFLMFIYLCGATWQDTWPLNHIPGGKILRRPLRKVMTYVGIDFRRCTLAIARNFSWLQIFKIT